MSHVDLLFQSAPRRGFLSPQASNFSTEAKLFAKPIYSPISTIQRDSASKTTFQPSEPSIQINMHRDTQEFQLRRGSYNDVLQNQHRLLNNDLYKTHQDRFNKRVDTDPDQKIQSERYSYLKPSIMKSPETYSYRKATEEDTSKSPNKADVNPEVYRLLHEKEESLRRQEAIKRETGLFAMTSTPHNLNKTGLAMPFVELLSPPARTTVANYTGKKTESHSQAYSKAMKALQDRVTVLEDDLKEKNRRKKNDERLEQNLQEAEKKVLESEQMIKEMERERRRWIEQIENVEREKEGYKKEREEILKEKEAIMRDREQWMKEKDEWIKIKEANSMKVYEAEKAKEEAERNTKTLEETVEKLEKENAEQKRTYHQHLKSLVLKNDALVLEVEQVKDYYDNQIRDFTHELTNIEEEHIKKIQEYELKIEELDQQNKDLQNLLNIRARSSSPNLAVKEGSKDSLVSGRTDSLINQLQRKGDSNIFRQISPLIKAADSHGSNEGPINKTSLFESYNGYEAEKKKEHSRIEGIWTPNDKMYEHAQAARLINSAMDSHERDFGTEKRAASKITINRNLSDEINKYLRIEDSQDQKNLGFYRKPSPGQIDSNNHIGDDVRDEQGTAQFKKSDTFGSQNAPLRGNSIDRDTLSSGKVSPAQEAFYSGYKRINDTRSPASRNLRERLLDKERELSELNENYQDLLKKIQNNSNALERSKMRSQLIGLTDEIQKANDEIYQIRKQESLA